MELVTERLVELLVILAAAKLAGEVMTRLRQPAVVGELIAGVVLGASVLGWVQPEAGGVVATLAEIGVILLLFEVGLETDLGSFSHLGFTAVAVAVIGVVTPFAIGYGAAVALGIGGGSAEAAIFVGAAMTATSVGITARVFGDLGRLDTDEARTVLGAAVIDDVLGLIILATVVGQLETGAGVDLLAIGWLSVRAVLFLGGVFVVGSAFAPWLLRTLDRLRVSGIFVVGSFIFAVAVGLSAELLAGLDPIVGAFAAGVVVARTPYDRQVAQALAPVGLLFIPVFFLSIGAGVDVSVLGESQVLVGGAVISVLAIAGKVVSGLGTFRKPIDAWIVGVGMIPRGEVGLIFAAIGLTRLSTVVTGDVHAIIVVMVIVTTLVAPVILAALLERAPAPTITPGTDPSDP